MLSITLNALSWTSDPSVLASALVLAGSASVWAIGYVASAISRAIGLG